MPLSIDLKDTHTRDALAARLPAVDDGSKPSLVGMDRAELGEALRQAGVRDRQVKMRVQQLWHWLYVRGVSDFSDMLNVSKDLRATLAERYTIARPEIVDEQISEDGTRKWLLRFAPRGAGKPVEIENGLYSRRRPRNPVHIQSGRLHSDLFFLPYRHPEARPQPDSGRNPGAIAACPRPAR